MPTSPNIARILRQLENPALPGIELGLSRMRALLSALGNPHEKLPPVIHVAGTNGKGSLIAYLRAILTRAGYRVHHYISPPLVRENERIVLGGKEIGDAYFLDLLQRVKHETAAHPVTIFEAITAAAFLAFSERKADILLLETGLGGRLDATNVVAAPILTAIAPVSIDHAEFLGNTLAAIAAEKAGIIKPGICVTGPQQPEALRVIEAKAKTANTKLLRFAHEWSAEENETGFVFRTNGKKETYPLPNLAGSHQVSNAATAIACLRALPQFRITQKDIAHGITHAVWKARLQRLRRGPLPDLLPRGWELWLDGGHNPAAGRILADWAEVPSGKPLYVICAMMNSKDARQFLKPISPSVEALAAIAIPRNQGSRSAASLSTVAKELGMASFAAASPRAAMQKILYLQKGCPGRILICGSLYLAGHILAENS